MQRRIRNTLIQRIKMFLDIGEILIMRALAHIDQNIDLSRITVGAFRPYNNIVDINVARIEFTVIACCFTDPRNFG